MYITRSTAQKLNIAINNIQINIEGDGTCRLTMPSLTGEGTHTKWYYPESMTLRGKEGKQPREFERIGSDTNGRCKMSADCSPVQFGGSSSAMSIHKPTSELGAMYTTDHVCNGWDSDVCSDATELVDEEAEREAWLKMSREDSLPNFPYERIMRRISQEPTVIVDEDISNGTGSFEI